MSLGQTIDLEPAESLKVHQVSVPVLLMGLDLWMALELSFAVVVLASV
jgi:hypothetical protein